MSSETDKVKTLGFNLSALTLRHRQVSLFFFLLIAVGGVMSYFELGQREDPDFTFRAMVIRTLWPGATATMVDQEITERLERKLLETPYFDKTQSYSKRGESLIILFIKDSSPPDVVEDIWYQVRKRLGDIRHTLPAEAQGPFFNDEFGDVFGSIYAFTADGFSHSELRRYVEDVRQKLLSVPDVAKVELIGVKSDKIFIEASHLRLAQLGLGVADVQAALAGQNAMVPAGKVETPVFAVPVNVDGQLASIDDIRDLPLRAAGRTLRLGDIAEVRRGYEDPPTVIMHFDGKEAIGLAVSMTANGDVLKLGENLRKRMEEIEAELPLGIEF
ncbi:MAG: efflux RND transporter permease subunit, partial [Gammaproteobacteria bacterium]|nr:efflux RND transporter permease subunit [Gammaproteobacteria bacterium]